MTEREALKLALEALLHAYHEDEAHPKTLEAITAIKEALAQPEQELLAWKNAALRVGEDLSSIGPNGYYNMTAQQWLDWAMAQQPRGNNSLAQPEQEFVAYIDMSEWPPVRFKEGTLRCDIAHLDGQKLYTTPPQRTWVGLTHSDIDQGLLRSDYAFKTAEAWRAGVVFAMTKLKQKNGYGS